MTAEERLLIELSDILALEFTCKQCGVKVGISPQKERHFIPTKCPGCGAEFFLTDGALHTAVRSLFSLLREGSPLPDGPFKLQLVLSPPGAKPSGTHVNLKT
jgi:hypothetical protein